MFTTSNKISKEDLSYQVEIYTPTEDRKNYRVFVYLKDSTELICRCAINTKNGVWQISGWYTEEQYKNKGIGRQTLKYTLDYIKKDQNILPDKIEYIWDGTHHYVHHWLKENFNAVSHSNIAVLKNSFTDDWEGHIYTLDREKFIEYFSLQNDKEISFI